MAFKSGSVLILLTLSSVIARTVACVQSSSAEFHNLKFPANTTTNATRFTASAPYFRNVTAGAAWVFPNSKFDLGARYVNCECFDPSQKCCMPSANTIPPFCVPMNATCCGNTYCSLGERCCGSSCCPAFTDCWFGAGGLRSGVGGCCAQGEECQGPSVCYDHSSGNCSNVMLPKAECCPPSIPFCRSFQPFGKGCYAYSSVSTTTRTSNTPPAQISTVCPEGIVVADSETARLDSGRAGQGCSAPLADSSQKASSTSTFTEIISAYPEPSGEYSFAFPTLSAEPVGVSINTTIVFALPPSTTTTTLAILTNTTSSSTPLKTSTSSASSTSSSSNSALCFDPTLQRPAACRSTKSGASSTDNGGLPGASTVSSQANTVLPPFTLPVSTYDCYSIGLTVFVMALGLAMANLACRDHESQPLARSRNGKVVKQADIHMVEDSGRVLVGDLQKEVWIVKSSGRQPSNGLRKAGSLTQSY